MAALLAIVDQTFVMMSKVKVDACKPILIGLSRSVLLNNKRSHFVLEEMCAIATLLTSLSWWSIVMLADAKLTHSLAMARSNGGLECSKQKLRRKPKPRPRRKPKPKQKPNLYYPELHQLLLLPLMQRRH